MNLLQMNSGQAQIMTASIIGIVMLSSALFTLQHAQQTTELGVRAIKRTEMRNALDAAIQQAAYIYRSDAGCDPFVLNARLSTLQLDGSLGSTPSLRQIQYSAGNNAYRIAFGAVRPLPDSPLPSSSAGSSQDAEIEVWTQFNGQRVVQRAALLNTCTSPCSARCPSAAECDDAPRLARCNTYDYPCMATINMPIAFHRITDPGNFPEAPGIPNTCFGDRFFGDLNDTSATCDTDPDGWIDMRDHLILKNYLRSGDLAGSSRTIMIGDAISRGCADLNRDGLVNETDLNILEKVLRGYLYWLPVR